MSCARTHRLLDAWIDAELDPATRSEMAAHFAACPACSALKVQREQLRESIREAAPRFATPASLQADVRRALAGEAAQRATRRRGPSWWLAGAMAGAAAVAGAFLTLALLRSVTLESPGDLAVATHVAALAAAQGDAGRLVQVAASDRHVVKPWFQGKVDFAPPVRDLTAQGFTLLGARLDRIGGQAAAAIVYRIRNHPVELFVWPAARGETQPLESRANRGFAVATWAADGLRFAVVSDVEAGDFDRFVAALRAP
jgi:anti-sigma factor RsiW